MPKQPPLKRFKKSPSPLIDLTVTPCADCLEVPVIDLTSSPDTSPNRPSTHTESFSTNHSNQMDSHNLELDEQSSVRQQVMQAMENMCKSDMSHSNDISQQSSGKSVLLAGFVLYPFWIVAYN